MARAIEINITTFSDKQPRYCLNSPFTADSLSYSWHGTVSFLANILDNAADNPDGYSSSIREEVVAWLNFLAEHPFREKDRDLKSESQKARDVLRVIGSRS